MHRWTNNDFYYVNIVRLVDCNHLNRIYFAKAHLVGKLPQLKDEVHFSDLKFAIQETVEDVEKQMARMELIYELLDAPISKGSIHGLTGLVDDAFEAIRDQAGEAELRDMSIIFYLQNIESVEWSCKWRLLNRKISRSTNY